MSLNWINSTDMLADAGIINFDAAAYIMGQPPRYIGSPNCPITQIPPLTHSQPAQDEYSPTLSDKSIVKTPLWKKVLFGAISIGGIIFAASKIKKMPDCIKNMTTKVTDFFKNLFKKKP